MQVMWVIQVLWAMKDICVAFFAVAIAQVLFIDIKITAYSMQRDLSLKGLAKAEVLTYIVPGMQVATD